MIEISISDEDFSRALRQLKSVPYGIQKAMYPAVAETMQHVRDVLVEYLIGEIPLPQKALNRAVLLGKPISRGGTVSGSITVRSKAQPLIHYDVEEKAVTARPGKRPQEWPDFTFALRKGERRDGRSRIEGASLPFIAIMQGGHMGVKYWKVSNSKRAYQKEVIRESYGPTIQYHVASYRVWELCMREIDDCLPVVLASHVQQTLALEAAK